MIGQWKYTPGPWRLHAAHADAGSAAITEMDGGKSIAVILNPVHSAPLVRSPLSQEQICNAHLIAAAPELLAALLELVPVMDRAESDASGTMNWEWVSRRINAARAAIAKAEGRA